MTTYALSLIRRAWYLTDCPERGPCLTFMRRCCYLYTAFTVSAVVLSVIA